jgi:hypothetical protein
MCRKVDIVKNVARTKENPVQFIQDVTNAAGQGPLMTAIKERMALMPPSRVVVFADPRVTYNRRELARLIEVLDLPPGTRFVIPRRSGTEREISTIVEVMGDVQQGKMFRETPLESFRDWRKMVGEAAGEAGPASPLRIQPDYTVDPISLVSRDLTKYSDRAGRANAILGARETSNETVAMMRAVLEMSRTPGDTMFITFGNSADIRALRRIVGELGKERGYIHYLQIGSPGGSQVLRELRPTPEAADFLLRTMTGVRPMSQMFTAEQLAAVQASKYAIMQQFPGRFRNASSGAMRAYGEDSRITRYNKILESVREEIAGNPNKKRLAKLRSIESNIANRLDEIYRQRYQIPQRFGEGIRSAEIRMVRESGSPQGMKEMADALGDRLAREVDAYGNARNYTEQEKLELAAWIAALKKRAALPKPQSEGQGKAAKIRQDYVDYLEGIDRSEGRLRPPRT